VYLKVAALGSSGHQDISERHEVIQPCGHDGVCHEGPGRRFSAPGPVSTAGQLALSCLWFAYNVEWGALLPIVWPAQVADIVGPARKELLSGVLIGLGAFVSLVVAPLAGALSDRSRNASGRRRPYLLTGVLGNVCLLLVMARLGRGTPVWTFVTAVVVLEVTANWWGGPYAGLIPDVVPGDQRGRASGYLMLMTVAGSLAGAAGSAQLLAAGGYALAYAAIAGTLLVLLAATLAGVREPAPPADGAPAGWRAFLRSLWLDPRRHRDFYWVLATRAFMTMGTFAVYSYVEYYAGDVLHLSRPEIAASILLAVGAAAALPSGLAAGVLSDRRGRKPVVYVTGTMTAAGALGYALLSFHPSWIAALAIAAVFGAGAGGYQAADWALAVDVLPRWRDAGKDMGIWHVALVLPQVVATPLSGILLDGLKRSSLSVAYAALFVMAALWFGLGTAFIAQVRGVR
jgi:MFS family permease